MTGIATKRRLQAIGFAALFCAAGVQAAGLFPSTLSTTLQPIPAAWLAQGNVVSRGVTPLVLFGMDLGKWERYAHERVRPVLGIDFQPREFERSLVRVDAGTVRQEFQRMWRARPDALFSVAVLRELTATTPVAHHSPFRLQLPEGVGSDLERTLVTSSYVQRIGASSVFDVAAVFAYQQFASQGLGHQVASLESDLGYDTWTRERSVGTGVRLGLSSELGDGVMLGISYQSRIDMDAFSGYRGVYSEPGDFDIPARTDLGVRLDTSRNSQLELRVQRVLYGDITPFTSAVLPDRFLSLLGDGGSPEFAWDDLTVYSVGWEFSSDPLTTWNVEVTTRQQPAPTSSVLYRALRDQLAERNMTVGVTRKIGQGGRFNLSASYAPTNLALGTTSLRRPSNALQEQVEVEAIWIWEF